MGLMNKLAIFLCLSAILLSCVSAWTGEIHGRVVCDVCGDSSIGPEDHVLEDCVHVDYDEIVVVGLICLGETTIGPEDHALEGAEIAVLCITKLGEVLNYQAFTNEKGIYTVAETMPESNRWDVCLARPISSFHEHCTRHGDNHAGIKFTYNLPSGHSHSIRPFIYRPTSMPKYCM